MFFPKLFRGVDDFLQSLNSFARQPIGSFCRLQTTDSEYDLVADDGSLVSVFLLYGNFQAVDDSRHAHIISIMTEALAPIFAHPGHALQVVFSYDPAGGRQEVFQSLDPARTTARNLGLDIDEVLLDWGNAVSRYVSAEHLFLVLWTRPDVLAPTVRKSARLEMGTNSATGPRVNRGTQNQCQLMPAIRNAHHKYVETISGTLKKLSMSFDLLDVHESIRRARLEIDPDFTGREWRALLPGDKIPLGYPEPGESDMGNLLYPALRRQIFPREGEEIDRRTIRIGDRFHSPLTVELMPQYPQPFNTLFSSLLDKPYPWRVSFLLEPDGIGGLSMRALLSSVLAFTNSANRQFNVALKELSERHLAGETINRFSIVWDTWVPTSAPNALKTLRNNAAELAGQIQSWGSCETAEVVGDPLLGVVATLPGVMPGSPAKKTAAPLGEALEMLPLTRCTSPWRVGSVLFRTPDGKVYPYQQGSSLQSAWVDIGVAPMGSGKSVLLNANNFGFILQPGLVRLPWLTILDVGPSSKGLISLFKEALPSDKKYLAAYHRLRMTSEYAINPFDTPIGYRTPPPAQMSFLTNFVSLLATPLESPAPPDGISGLATLCIEKAYDCFSDAQEPKRYNPEIDAEVAACVTNFGLYLDDKTTWWEIVDKLFANGFIHEAWRAQRYAVPLLAEVAAFANDERVRSLYNATLHGEPITAYFWRHMVESIKSYPILREPTKFDLGDAQIISLDLDEVAPKGGPAADRQTGVMFMLARQIGASRFFFMPEDVDLAPESYRTYHQERIESIRKDPKRLCYDETHRIMRSGSMVSKQIVEDLQTVIRESRKWSVSVGMYTQSIDDFPHIIVELATSVYILGANTQKSVNTLVDWFNLNEQCKYAILRLGKPDQRGARMVARFRVATEEGSAQQVLVLSLGSQAIWAFSSTTEDVALRDSLIQKIGQREALRLLGALYPGGVKKEADQRKMAVRENEFGKNFDVLQQIEEDILEQFRNGGKLE